MSKKTQIRCSNIKWCNAIFFAMPSLEEEIMQTKFRSEQHRAIINLVFTGNWLTAQHTKFLRTYNLTEQQFNILRILRGQQPRPASINLIKERMLDKMSDVSRIVERMRKLGLVEREICPSDRRSVEVVITEQGLELLTEVDEHAAKVDSVLDNLNNEELQTLNTLLDKLRG